MENFYDQDHNVDQTIKHQAKDFLNISCDNVLKKYENIVLKDKLKNFIERLFYSKQIEKTQIKIWIYKLTELKMRRFAEDKINKYYIGKEHQQKERAVCKKEASGFLNNIIHKTVVEYKSYCVRVNYSATVIQKIFKGYLFRFIHKMEIMNHKLMLECERAEAKARKTIASRRQSMEKNKK
jgi:hypothetical protein